jgi:ABC-type antimicrobial peptide transport system permease subunit
VLASTAAGACGGLALGMALALLVLPWIGDYLYQLPARDTATYAGSAGVLFIVSLAASAFPALGATRVNVVDILRED